MLRNKDLIINISLSLVSIILCSLLIIIFIEARFFIKMQKYLSYAWHDPNTKFDSELGWGPIPNTKVYVPDWGTITSNSHGFRSAEIDRNKKQIIILGDSVAWGFSVSDKETFPYFLDKLVSNSGYQVSNLAVSGYDLGQYYLFLKKHIDKFNNLKQVVLVICTQNDLVCTGRNFDNGKRKPLFTIRNDDLMLTNNNISEYCLRNLFSRSYFLGKYLPNKGLIGKALSQISGDKTLSSGNELEKVSRALLQKIYELILSHNAKLLVVLSPSTKDFIEKSASLNAFEYVFKELKLKDLSYIDYIEVLKKEDRKELKSLYLDDGHYTKKGNLLLAKTVYSHLSKDD